LSDKLSDYDHKNYIRSKYKISPEEYNKLLKDQNNVCAICGGINSSGSHARSPRRLCIDHHHASNKIRGLLCNQCNRGIGLLKDSQGLLLNAFQYLYRAEKERENVSNS